MSVAFWFIYLLAEVGTEAQFLARGEAAVTMSLVTAPRAPFERRAAFRKWLETTVRFDWHITNCGSGVRSCPFECVLYFCKDVFCIWVFGLHGCVYFVCPLVPLEVRRGCRMPWNRSDRTVNSWELNLSLLEGHTCWVSFLASEIYILIAKHQKPLKPLLWLTLCSRYMAI